MRVQYALPAVALIAAVSAAPSNQPAVSMKCPYGPVVFADAPEPVYVLDRKAIPLEQFKEQLNIAPRSIESVAIVCATEVHREFGVKANRTAVVMFTIPGPYTALKNSMEPIVAMQKEYRAKNGVFAKTIADLPWKDESGLITVSLTVDADGSRWFATGTHRHLFKTIYSVSGIAEK